MRPPDAPVWVKMQGEVVARRLNGTITTAEPLEAMVDLITYDVRVFNTRHIVPESSLRNMTPYGRVTADMDIRAAKVGQPCEVMVKADGPFWLNVAESLISGDCVTAGGG